MGTFNRIDREIDVPGRAHETETHHGKATDHEVAGSFGRDPRGVQRRLTPFEDR